MNFLQTLYNIFQMLAVAYLLGVIISSAESIYNNIKYHKNKITSPLSPMKRKKNVVFLVISIVSTVIALEGIASNVPTGRYRTLAEISYGDTASQYEILPVEFYKDYDEEIHTSYFFVNGEEQEHTSYHVVYRLTYLEDGNKEIPFTDDSYVLPNETVCVYLQKDEDEIPVYVNIGEISPETLGMSLSERWNGLEYKLVYVLSMLAVVYDVISRFSLLRRNRRILQIRQDKLEKGEMTEEEKQAEFNRVKRYYIGLEWLRTAIKWFWGIISGVGSLYLTILTVRAIKSLSFTGEVLLGLLLWFAYSGCIVFLCFWVVFEPIEKAITKIEDNKNKKIDLQNEFNYYKIFGNTENQTTNNLYE